MPMHTIHQDVQALQREALPSQRFLSPRHSSQPFLPTWRARSSPSAASSTSITAAPTGAEAGAGVGAGAAMGAGASTSPVPAPAGAVPEIREEDMDLVGLSLLGTQVNLRELVVRPNTMTLVAVSSSEFAFPRALAYHRAFLEHYAAHPVAGAEGVTAQAVVCAISDGWIVSRLLRETLRKGHAQLTPPAQHASTLLFFSEKDTDLVSRARRYIEAFNRVGTHLYLLDSEGRVRWKASSGHLAPPEFLKILFALSDGLALETMRVSLAAELAATSSFSQLHPSLRTAVERPLPQ